VTAGPDGGRGVPHFGEPESELASAFETCILVDRSDLSSILATGPDLLGLLNRLSTGKVDDLTAGEGRPTVLTTSKGRIVERLFVHHLGERGVLMVGSAGSSGRVLEHLDRFTFSENTGLADVTPETRLFALVGPRAAEAAERAGLPIPAPYACARTASSPLVDVLGQDGMSSCGLTVRVRRDDAGPTWDRLHDAVQRTGGRAAGEAAIESYRVLCGFPAGGAELTEDHNPLEAGLLDAISFDKGCYVGQEVVARLNSRDKVARRLIGVALDTSDAPPPRGAEVFVGERPVGRITSALIPAGSDHPVGIAYVKRREADVGDACRVDAPERAFVGRLIELPFRSPEPRPAGRSEGREPS